MLNNRNLWAVLTALTCLAPGAALASRHSAPPPPGSVRVLLGRFAGVNSLQVDAGICDLYDASGRGIGAEHGALALAASRDGVTGTDADGRPISHGSAVAEAVLHSGAGGAVQIGVAGAPLRAYRGSITIDCVRGRLRAINTVDMEAYLRGVVPAEMGAAPLEALKAQAVACRTWAAARMLHARGDWDVTDGVDCQVYGGISAETPHATRAVLQTAGLILTDNGVPIEAMFSSNCGGRTAPGGPGAPYLRSVSDGAAHPDAGDEDPWSFAVSADQLSTTLARSGLARGDTGSITDIRVIRKDVSGRATAIEIGWSGGTSGPTPNGPEGIGGGACPGPMVPESADVQGAGDGEQEVLTGTELRAALGASRLRSTLFKVTATADGDFRFDGRGYGHGLGLCQTGAIALAGPLAHENYRTILAHYYTGALLTREPGIDSAVAEPAAYRNPGFGRLRRRNEVMAREDGSKPD
ncbi:MAG: SpoIID/LytB domain-containing protein [Armatimonadetes bacterium]|nr:SpoIID/LytB domain-containing protein [Armatimonadota bacterium]MDE2206710.1 SpoIID/LytB domain-containing protein [Armatimonadota bacterium]